MYLIQIKLGYENLIGGNDIPIKEIDISAYIINEIFFSVWFKPSNYDN